ncbi:sensor histidine kinase [Actinomadura keratinilytica]
MRRHSENLLVLAGAEHGHSHAGPVPLVDVARAAVSETERYERIRISTLPPHSHLAGFAADDLSHLLAELMENATSFSPPDAQVEVSGWLLESGEVMLSVQDEGIGMAEERLAELNKRLARVGTDGLYEPDGDGGLGLGLYVVARIAARHGIRVQLRTQQQGGVTSVVVLPKSILAAAPSGTLPASVDAAAAPPRCNCRAPTPRPTPTSSPSRAATPRTTTRWPAAPPTASSPPPRRPYGNAASPRTGPAPPRRPRRPSPPRRPRRPATSPPPRRRPSPPPRPASSPRPPPRSPARPPPRPRRRRRRPPRSRPRKRLPRRRWSCTSPPRAASSPPPRSREPPRSPSPRSRARPTSPPPRARTR